MRKRIKSIGIVIVAFVLICSMMLAGCDLSGINTPFGPKPSEEPEEPVVYTLQYTDDEGTHQIEVQSGALYTIESIPQRKGFDFIGLFDAEINGTRYVSASGASLAPYTDNKNMVLYPQFKPKEYTFYLNYGESAGSGVPYIKASYGETLQGLPTYLQSADGTKDFCGWYTQSGGGGIQVATESTIIAGNAVVQEPLITIDNPSVNLYTHFEAKTFVVSFYSTDGNTLLQSMTLPYGTNISDVAGDIMQNNKVVLSWSTIRGGSPFTGIVDHDMSLYAKELGIRVTFNSNGGDSIAPVDMVEGGSFQLPVPTRRGYTFTGWYDVYGNLCDSSYVPTENTTLTARWNAESYTITLNANGGTVAQTSQSVTYGSMYQLPVPARAGYDFCGWYCSDVQMTSSQGAALSAWNIIADQNFIAIWRMQGSVTLSLKRENCKQDNGFDPSAQDTGADGNHHNGFELGELLVSNCSQNGNGNFTAIPGQGPSLKYKLLCNPADLKTYGWGIESNYLNDDTYTGSVYGTNINRSKIGKGAYYIRVNYTDGSYTESNAVNFMASAKKDSEILLNYNVNSNKKIKSIDVVILYELTFKVYMAFSGNKYTYSNWRCTTTLYFE